MASITITVGNGVPGHAAIQVTKGDETTYMGLGPRDLFPFLPVGRPYTPVGKYDIVTLPNGVSPVGRIRDPNDGTGEFHYVDPRHYDTTSYTFQISDAQADAAFNAAISYRDTNQSYNVGNRTICTDFALSILQAVIPGSNTSQLSRIPSTLASQLNEVAHSGTFEFSSASLSPGPVYTPPIYFNPHLTGIQKDASPPDLKNKLPINDDVPFNYARGGDQAEQSFSPVRFLGGSSNPGVGNGTFAPSLIRSFSDADGRTILPTGSSPRGLGVDFDSAAVVPTRSLPPAPPPLTQAAIAPLSRPSASVSPPPASDAPHWLAPFVPPIDWASPSPQDANRYDIDRLAPGSSAGGWLGLQQSGFGGFGARPQGNLGNRSDLAPDIGDRSNTSATNPLISMGLLRSAPGGNQAPFPAQAATAPASWSPPTSPSTESDTPHSLAPYVGAMDRASTPLAPQSDMPPWLDPEAVGNGLRRFLGFPE